MSDFFLGRFSNFEQGIGEYKNTRMHFLATFIQDTFRVNRQLTLNFGLRWDPFFPYTDETNRLGCYRPGERSTVYVNAPVGVVYPGDAACPEGGYDASWTDFGPRVGVAYDPFGDGKSSVRAGYGIYYDRPNTISTNSPANQAPFGTLVTFTGDSVNNVANPYAGRTNPFPADPFNTPANVQFFLPNATFSYDPNLKNGRLQSWNLTLEREIMPTYLVRVGYAGSHGDRLAMGRELNAAVYATGATTGTTQQRRPLSNFSTITTIESTGRSTYHALQLTLDKRMGKRFSVLSSYTLAKNLDHAGENKQTGSTQTNPYDLEFDWGFTNADRRHRFVTSFLWLIPGEFDNPVRHRRFERLVAHRHPGDAERWRASALRAVSTMLEPARADSAPTSRAIPTCRPIVPMRRRSCAGSIPRFTRRMRWEPSAPPRGTVCAGLERRTSISACTRPSPRAEAPDCSCALKPSMCSTGSTWGIRRVAQNSTNFGRILALAPGFAPRVMQFAMRLSF